MRTILLLIIAVLIGGLAALNWEVLSAPSEVNLGLSTIHAPLGILMLGLTVLLCVLFIAYVLSLQGSVMLEARRHNKEMTAQRELADKAEASRFTELRQVLERQHAEGQAALMARMGELESHLIARVQESDNSNAAYIGQLEDRIKHGEPGTRSGF
ncbi:LapA family protein [Comamonas sp. J-3]|jgi:Na+-transporting methylmalonyl-CoA/oxaloacetate decarboxylase gamma subunit|uniref:LapA family protein n=1 Tax=Comamonas trifloxystrobinivorans TaxID=3350256 RepID=UPI0037286CA2